ncbi:PH domain-containing protein [Planococcus sp. CP5-4]|uniref:PH domain-containing protein n=1 Tax=unclassified Planococcus (in: firmicutes) TaxID=2662419 RepID=UPI001C2286ED|nr:MULTISPECIES: PH domain-containing protein [unclassified Planococcus (in: firmicutes)]MBU9673874.1 PH domain-containing protein [Planococcus sp. CP5-4_YE]MBV0909744.1 PH domain-containing protein [Planococcus sp. CP5-4_UN]MBW6065228.1 PH domain-containing protein [Planococcus sp. CP5-4]
MVFHSKIDSFFIRFLIAAILFIAAVSFIPLLFENAPFSAFVIVTVTFFVTTALILWITFAIQYVFLENHLLVKAGPFRSRIPSDSILKVSPTRDIFTGYRLLSSRDALELINNTTIFGTVKISPENQDVFIAELQKRCPGLKLDKIF